MAINLSLANIFVICGLLTAIMTGLAGSMSAIMEWRVSAIQHQLDDRMTAYQREMERVEKRLEALERR